MWPQVTRASSWRLLRMITRCNSFMLRKTRTTKLQINQLKEISTLTSLTVSSWSETRSKTALVSFLVFQASSNTWMQWKKVIWMKFTSSTKNLIFHQFKKKLKKWFYLIILRIFIFLKEMQMQILQRESWILELAS